MTARQLATPGPGAAELVDQLLVTPAVTRISASAYDTAILARLRTGDGGLLLPATARWLLANQHPDGSWGGSVEAPHDRCVCTLAAVVALTESGLPDLADVIERGVRSLWPVAEDLRPGDWRESIAFEVIVPMLLDRARELGLKLPFDQLAWVTRERAAKLGRVPPDAYERITTLVHSLEAFPDWPSLAGLGSPDGSFGSSPAATAAAYATEPSATTLDYFATVTQAAGGTGGVPTVYPYRTFDDAWTYNALLLGGVSAARIRPHAAWLASQVTDRGIGPAAGLPPDADDTGMVLPVLAACGYPVDLGVLSHFETPDGYVTFELERGFSVSTNVHVLGALRLDREGMARQIRIVLDYLRSQRREGAFWVDKWHLSPMYATGHAIPALHGLDEELCGPALAWVLATQRRDGSWGSLEETAYALLALLTTLTGHPHVEPALHRGMEFVRENWSGPTNTHPELWIGKVLYSPYRVIDAALAGAWHGYHHR